MKHSIFIVVSFLIGLLAASESIAEDVFECPSEPVPIQITKEQTEPAGHVTTLAATRITDRHFKAFVTTVTNHVAVQLAKNKRCLESVESKKRSLLHFVNWPLIFTRDKPLAPAPSLDMPPSSVCRITSPWIDLAVERQPVLSISAIIRWNGRQLVADQAVLDGAKDIPSGVAKPLRNSGLGRFVREYAKTELCCSEPGALAAANAETRPVEERVPPDILWLFRHSGKIESGMFAMNVVRAMDNATSKGDESYTKLVIALIDRCLASDGANLHYGSILDAADLISLEHYKIDSLTH